MAFDGTDGGCWKADIPYGVEYAPRLHVAKFGDGYEQRAFEGINPNIVTWKLNWSMRPETIIEDMIQFLGELYGAAFLFNPPNRLDTIWVFCDSWSVQWVHKGNDGTMYGSLSAEFRRAYGASLNQPALP